MLSSPAEMLSARCLPLFQLLSIKTMQAWSGYRAPGLTRRRPRPRPALPALRPRRRGADLRPGRAELTPAQTDQPRPTLDLSMSCRRGADLRPGRAERLREGGAQGHDARAARLHREGRQLRQGELSRHDGSTARRRRPAEPGTAAARGRACCCSCCTFVPGPVVMNDSASFMCVACASCHHDHEVRWHLMDGAAAEMALGPMIASEHRGCRFVSRRQP